MGAKVTVDSATLMNKGLELIEAMRLFALAPDKIAVLVHPQSIVHSMVEFADASVLAQLGAQDMRLPIQYALTYPARRAGPARTLDLARAGTLSFEEPDFDAFPCLPLAISCAERDYASEQDGGGAACAVMNAANEIAVAAFLEGRLGFTGICGLIEQTLSRLSGARADSIDAVVAADAEARKVAAACISS
jgi:1-deoxy-D-xylulose-5-phosphate reductoisomerase